MKLLPLYGLKTARWAQAASNRSNDDVIDHNNDDDDLEEDKGVGFPNKEIAFVSTYLFITAIDPNSVTKKHKMSDISQ